MHETVNRGKNDHEYINDHSKLTCELSFWNVSRKDTNQSVLYISNDMNESFIVNVSIKINVLLLNM